MFLKRSSSNLFANCCVDENIPKVVKKSLVSKGHSVEYVPKGISNSKVASLALNKERILVTSDSNFSNTILFPPKEFFGIIVLRIHPQKLRN
jgi:predicted nuclease of predicted toxin-antitoxin system